MTDHLNIELESWRKSELLSMYLDGGMKFECLIVSYEVDIISYIKPVENDMYLTNEDETVSVFINVGYIFTIISIVAYIVEE